MMRIVPPSRNGFLGNSIYSNGGLGIDLANRIGGLGVTWNRFPNGSTTHWSDYVNHAQNFPDLYLATVSVDLANPVTSQVGGRLYAAAGTYRIEIFLNDAPDGSGNGEGKTLVGVAEDVNVTGGDGIVDWSASLTEPLFGGELLAATATDASYNTSEFSPNLVAGIITRLYGSIQDPDVGPNDTRPNRWVVNTTYSGIPLHMPDGEAYFRIGSSFDGAAGTDLKPIIEDAFDQWNTVNIFQGVPLQYRIDPSPEMTDVWGGTPDGSNTVVLVEDQWKTRTNAPEEALAVTRVRYNALTGEIVDADIAFNREHFDFLNYSEDPDPDATPADNADFKSVLVHEGGHFGGIADRYNPGDPYFTTFMGLDVTGPSDPVTMYGIIKPYDTYQRVPHDDDKAAIAFIYGNVPTAHVDLMLLFDASPTFADPGSYNGFAASKAAASELVDKARPGDLIGVRKLSDDGSTSFTEILDEASRTTVKGQISALQEDFDDIRPLGLGLKGAAESFGSVNTGRRAIIAFTAGNETESPFALDPTVISTLKGAGVSVYSAGGYTQSISGQATLSGLSNETEGAYFLTADTTVSEVATQIWNLLTGYQLVGDSTMPSNAISWQGKNDLAISWQGTKDLAISWQGTKDLAISWQGKVDNGTTALLPAISWQGKTDGAVAKVSASAALAAATSAKFVLALIPPGFDESELYGTTGDPYGVITPFNYTDYVGVTYVEGPTYAFYQITGEFQNNPLPKPKYLLPNTTWGI